MTDLTERVARAICESEGLEWEHDVPPAMHSHRWRVCSDSYFHYAKIAVRVMQADAQDGPIVEAMAHEAVSAMKTAEADHSPKRRVIYGLLWEALGEAAAQAALSVVLRVVEDERAKYDKRHPSDFEQGQENGLGVLISRLSEGPAPNPWRPIETAPIESIPLNTPQLVLMGGPNWGPSEVEYAPAQCDCCSWPESCGDEDWFTKAGELVPIDDITHSMLVPPLPTPPETDQ